MRVVIANIAGILFFMLFLRVGFIAAEGVTSGGVLLATKFLIFCSVLCGALIVKIIIQELLRQAGKK